MMYRHLPVNPTLTDHLLYWMFEAMGRDWRGRGVRPVHETEIAQRVMGLWKRLNSVFRRWQAGTLRAPRDAHPSPPPQERERGRAARVLPGWSVLPRTYGWLKTLLLPETRNWVDAFNCLLLNDPEMKALYAAAPQVGRILRPFCHFLGIGLPEELRLPKRERVRRSDLSPRPVPVEQWWAEAHPTAHPTALRDERSEMIVPNRRLPPREQAEDAVRRSEARGKPIDLRRFTPAALGWFLHPPRDANCPPPEIGYGGRWRPLPKDYKPPGDGE